MPGRVEGHSVALFGDNAFIIGGFDSYGVTDRIMKVNLKTMAGSIVAAKLCNKRENHTSQILDGNKIVVIGGWNGKEAIAAIEVLCYESGTLFNRTNEF